MKPIGVVRKFDNLGRLVIPVEMRKTLNINVGDPMDIHICDGSIVVSPTKVSCTCCDSEANLFEVAGTSLCDKCIAKFLACSKVR